MRSTEEHEAEIRKEHSSLHSEIMNIELMMRTIHTQQNSSVSTEQYRVGVCKVRNALEFTNTQRLVLFLISKLSVITTFVESRFRPSPRG